ncbi:uncharacterized protein [Pseudorca crassidens]|uniref:uncharacterized protein n=1 Tax=Pseudorca crassidens TaxID=82174 RepID=UPI00352C27AF
MFICICTHVHTHTFIHIHVYAFVCLHAHVCLHGCIHIYLYMYMYIYNGDPGATPWEDQSDDCLKCKHNGYFDSSTVDDSQDSGAT